jgi:hypothetical protein
VGGGLCSAALFPLSLLMASRAVPATAVLMGLAAVSVTVARIRRRSRKSRGPARNARGGLDAHRRRSRKSRDHARTGWGALDYVLLVLIGLAVAAFLALNFRYAYLWDGFLIFASKAKRLFYEGGLTRVWFVEDIYNVRLLTYPPLIALSEALLSRIRGSFDFDAFKPLFSLFHVSMLLSTFAALRPRTSRPVALVGTLFVVLLPELSTQAAAGGYSDMPQAAFVAGTVAACFRPQSRRSLPWLIGSLTVVKAEGTILALVAAAGVLVFWSFGGPRHLFRRVRIHARAVAVVAAFLFVRLAFLRWVDAYDATYGPMDGAHLRQAFERLGLVAGLCVRAATALPTWGLLWPAFAVASVLLFIHGTHRERCLSGAVWGGLLAYSAIFLFTNWKVPVHIGQAYPRLLAHIAPAAAIAICFAYVRVSKRWVMPGRTAPSAAGPVASGSRARSPRPQKRTTSHQRNDQKAQGADGRRGPKVRRSKLEAESVVAGRNAHLDESFFRRLRFRFDSVHETPPAGIEGLRCP